jgi:hypothetical protein
LNNALTFVQSPGNAFILVANLAPNFDPFQFYVAGNPTVWVRSLSVFNYENAPTITSISPNYVLCRRDPISIKPGQPVTHNCDKKEVDVNGCGYEVQKLAFCSFFGSYTSSDGTRIQNAPYSRGTVTSNQQIRCPSPTGTKDLQSDCSQTQNSSFIIGSRSFGIAQSFSGSSSKSERACTLDQASWFPLPKETQVNFTFYDEPAYVKLTKTTSEDLKSSPDLKLKFLKVSSQSSRHNIYVLVSIFYFLSQNNSNGQVTMVDSGNSDLSVPFDFASDKDNPSNPANTDDFKLFYGGNSYDM